MYNIDMITVEVQGHGSFIIPSSSLNELLQWLSANAMAKEANTRGLRDNETLLNE
mgnify:CR=1 FL=1|tara:strand:- start:1733 stop:1897 length:165 start_codon:yes stop_codon:yes gene_type:complete